MWFAIASKNDHEPSIERILLVPDFTAWRSLVPFRRIEKLLVSKWA